MTEIVANLDMESVSEDKRAGTLDYVLELTGNLLKQKFPDAQGYVHKSNTYAPIKGHPNVLAHNIVVYKGLFWGYRVRITPTDFQIRGVHVILSRHSHLTEILLTCAIVPAFLLMVGMLIYVVPKWGTYDDYRTPIILVFFFPFFVGAALFGIFYALSRPFAAMMTNKQTLMTETADLVKSLHDTVVKTA
jgi:hypothetical protein